MVRIIQNYTLYEIIGEGAYGKVFRAINKNDNKQYAVKVIQVRRFKQNKKLQECTVNEINILTNIEKHEHIIKYIDMLKTPNNFYFVYEFCNGGTLEGVLRKEKSLSQGKALVVFRQLIDAFQVLNKYNIMHRDLKPDNIFFSNGVVKLGDFGFCKSLEKANMTKTMLGSPIYMAPEILRGEIYSTKADIWSLGVVLYQMLYGFCPFQSTTIPKLIQVLKETQLEFPPNQQVSNQCKNLVRRLLTKDATRRIEWMQLLRVNISPQGKLVSQNRGVISLTQEDNIPLHESTRTLESTRVPPVKEEKKDIGSTHSFSPPSNQFTRPEALVANPAFAKKKIGTAYEAPTRKYSLEQSEQQKLKNKLARQHSQANRGLQIAIDMVKSNDASAVLFAYLILKRVEQRLVAVRDQAGEKSQFRQLVSVLNTQLRQVGVQLAKYGLNENLANWKALVKATGEYHRNFRGFYMMVTYLSGEAARQDLSHVDMQMEIRNKLY